MNKKKTLKLKKYLFEEKKVCIFQDLNQGPLDPNLLTLPLHHEVSSEDRKKTSKVLVQSNQVMAGDSKIQKLKLFFEKFYVTKKSKNVEIVFIILKAKSGSIAIKIRQPFIWTDPYLPGLFQGRRKV
jgi:hypothetical protein